MSQWNPGVEGLQVVVTGASSGIGEATAELLIESGAVVYNLDLVPSKSPSVTSITCDMSDPASIDAAVTHVPRAIDALVNVAGVPGTKTKDLVFRVNFLGLRYLTDTLFSRLRDGGAVVNVASTAGFQWPARQALILDLLQTSSFEDGVKWFENNAPDDVGPYDFSKEIITLYTMANGLRGLSQGVRFNSVSPGPVDTPILPDFEQTMGKATLDAVRAMTGRHGRPSDIAPVIAFLLSPASRWISGNNIIADSGAINAVVSGAVGFTPV